MGPVVTRLLDEKPEFSIVDNAVTHEPATQKHVRQRNQPVRNVEAVDAAR